MVAGSKQRLIALAGNPNCGKSTLFNAITGARQHVGNYPGITVEKKEGYCSLNGSPFKIIDLPGIYSLTAYSLEELVARDFLVSEQPELVVNIVDASNLERNLYLTVQFLELGVPIVIALNMMDVAESRGINIQAAKLADRLGVPVIPTVARSGKGKELLLEKAAILIEEGYHGEALHVSYGPEIDFTLDNMVRMIEAGPFLEGAYPARWIALKYLEADEQVMRRGRETNPQLATRLEDAAGRLAEHIQKTFDSYPEAIIADHRYGLITTLLRDGVVTRRIKGDRLYLSDRIDQVLTNRFCGPLIMFAVLYAVYQVTFTYSELPVRWLEAAIAALSAQAERWLPAGPVKSLVVSGLIGGVGGVLGFVPLIMLMFLAIAFLEDTGYLARVAYMLDRVFRVFGLHGSSVMAYIISGGIAGGCAVPGVMATRTLRSSRERLATLLTAPFMNCGAKLPVFAMLIAAFFPAHQPEMMFALTLLAWCAALLLARLIRSTILRGPSTPFLLELPPYRLPTFKGLLIHTWERTWQYVQKAGTTILAISVLFWALMSFPGLRASERHHFDAQRQQILGALPAELQGAVSGAGEDTDLPPPAEEARRGLRAVASAEAYTALKGSYAGQLGELLESVTGLAGFDWRTNIALLGGFAAKEVIIATLSTAYSLGQVETGKKVVISEHLARDPGWDPLKAFTLIVFIMLYAPCFVAVTCIVKESGSWKWGAFSILFNTSVAFLVAAVVYKGGRWLAS
jgi:ferrous iron transport protein B